MSLPSFAWVRDLDGHAWRTATWSAPFVVQAVFGMLFLVMLALRKGNFTPESGHSERSWMLTASAITTLASLVFVAALLQSPVPRHRALALSLAGSSAVVLITAVVYAYFLLA